VTAAREAGFVISSTVQETPVTLESIAVARLGLLVALATFEWT